MHASPARTSTLHLPALSARNRSPKGGDRELDAACRKEVSKKGQLVSDAPRGLRAREPSATLAHTKASRKRRGKNAFLEEVWLTFRDCGAGVRVTWPSICGQYSRGIARVRCPRARFRELQILTFVSFKGFQRVDLRLLFLYRANEDRDDAHVIHRLHSLVVGRAAGCYLKVL